MTQGDRLDVTRHCRCIMAAHCNPGHKGGECKLRAGGTVNEGGGVCSPKGVSLEAQLAGAVSDLFALALDAVNRCEAGGDAQDLRARLIDLHRRHVVGGQCG